MMAKHQQDIPCRGSRLRAPSRSPLLHQFHPYSRLQGDYRLPGYWAELGLMLERPTSGVRPNGGASLFTGFGRPRPPRPLQQRKALWLFPFPLSSRVLLFNTVATPAASCRGLLHPSTWPIHRCSLFFEGEQSGKLPSATKGTGPQDYKEQRLLRTGRQGPE